MVFPHCTRVNFEPSMLAHCLSSFICLLPIRFFLSKLSLTPPSFLPMKGAGGWQAAWCYTTGPCGLHCFPAALTSLDIHTHLLPCKMADLVTIQKGGIQEE